MPTTCAANLVAFTADLQLGENSARTSATDATFASRTRSSYDPLQRVDKRELVQRIRTLERELDAERCQRGALAYEQQALSARCCD